MKQRWQDFFMSLCAVNAQMSKDPSTQVGAVIVRPDRTIASMGWNGFPIGFEETPNDYENRNFKYQCIIHAEMNAILRLREPALNYTIFSSCPVCDRCMAHVAQAGIRNVYQPEPSEDYLSRWSVQHFTAGIIATRNAISVVTYTGTSHVSR